MPRRDDLIGKLKNKIGEQNAAIVALEGQQKAIPDQLRVSEEELAIKSSSLIQAQQDLTEQRSKRTGKWAVRSRRPRDPDAMGGLAAILEKTARTGSKREWRARVCAKLVEQMA